MIERLNRTYKQSYRPTNGFDNIDGANYNLALWVAYYNFLRPHKNNGYKVLNQVDILTSLSSVFINHLTLPNSHYFNLPSLAVFAITISFIVFFKGFSGSILTQIFLS